MLGLRTLRNRIHELWRTLLHEHTQPGRVAGAVLLGCIVGCTPFFGLHFFICIGFAWLFRLNKIIVYGAANLSVPPMIPILGFTSVQLGERILHGRFLELSRADFTWQNARPLAHQFFFSWLTGGLLLGATIGIVVGGIVYALLKLRGAPDEVLDRAAARFDDAPRRFKWYARMKYRMDPCYRALSAHIRPNTFTVDLGTGLGMLPIWLATMGEGRRALGVEWDVEKARAGKHAATGLETVEIREGDVRTVELPSCDVITLVDVLHYYEPDAQRALLARCRSALGERGLLLVRDGDGERRGGARFTRSVEAVVTKLGWNRGPKVKFRPADELKADLETLGFRVRVDEAAGRLHPGNVLFVAECSQPVAQAS